VLQGNNDSDSLCEGWFRFHAPSHAERGLRRRNPSDKVKRFSGENRRRMRHIHLARKGDVVRGAGSGIVLANLGNGGEAGNSQEQEHDRRSQEKRPGEIPAPGQFAILNGDFQE